MKFFSFFRELFSFSDVNFSSEELEYDNETIHTVNNNNEEWVFLPELKLELDAGGILFVGMKTELHDY